MSVVAPCPQTHGAVSSCARRASKFVLAAFCASLVPLLSADARRFVRFVFHSRCPAASTDRTHTRTIARCAGRRVPSNFAFGRNFARSLARSDLPLASRTSRRERVEIVVEKWKLRRAPAKGSNEP